MWQDVTTEILGLGIAGRNLADYRRQRRKPLEHRQPVYGASCAAEPNPNAIIRLQRVRDVPTLLAPCGVNRRRLYQR